MIKRVILLILLAPNCIAAPIQSAGERLKEGKIELHNRSGNTCEGKVVVATSVVREGEFAYKHIVPRCANRAEMRMQSTEIGKSYWQKWSLYIPTDYSFQASNAHIFAQWSTFPKANSTVLPCQGVGHGLVFNKANDALMYNVQGSSNANGRGGGFCKKILVIPEFNKLKGKWIDFIQYATWTGGSDGVVKIWVRIDKEQSYKQVVNYTGVTWWNDETNGPAMKMGLYKGGAGNWKGGRDEAIVYTDNYKLYDGKMSFEEVAK